MRREDLPRLLGTELEGFAPAEVPAGVKLARGKVREIFDLGDRLLILTTDRISAFDRVLAVIPCKGEVLNRMSLFWFDKTRDIIGNHLLEELSPRAVLVKKCRVLPVEVVVRGYLTGSAWRDYRSGNAVSGIRLPAGMKNNQKFDEPLLTPSTKEAHGTHDMPISGDEIVSRGLVEERLWRQVEETAKALFLRGTEIAARQGLILVDTKYEFGLLDGRLVLVDELHTPDSSRYWYADTYDALFAEGKDQRKVDKEYLRQWLMERGFMGDGEPPVIPDEVRLETAWRYIEAFQQITGTDFVPGSSDPEAEKEKILSIVRTTAGERA
jgi:phosphoribosylaminoimidazole-succinocarboxamide synthase